MRWPLSRWNNWRPSLDSVRQERRRSAKPSSIAAAFARASLNRPASRRRRARRRKRTRRQEAVKQEVRARQDERQEQEEEEEEEGEEGERRGKARSTSDLAVPSHEPDPDQLCRSSLRAKVGRFCNRRQSSSPDGSRLTETFVAPTWTPLTGASFRDGGSLLSTKDARATILRWSALDGPARFRLRLDSQPPALPGICRQAPSGQSSNLWWRCGACCHAWKLRAEEKRYTSSTTTRRPWRDFISTQASVNSPESTARPLELPALLTAEPVRGYAKEFKALLTYLEREQQLATGTDESAHDGPGSPGSRIRPPCPRDSRFDSPPRCAAMKPRNGFTRRC